MTHYKREPTFNINHFATLLGQPVRQEEVEDVNVWSCDRYGNFYDRKSLRHDGVTFFIAYISGA